MATRTCRPIVLRSPALGRWFSTSTATPVTVTGNKPVNSMYGELISIELSDANIADNFNKWMGQRKPVKKVDIIRYVNYLRKGKKFDHALQFHEWMYRNMNNINDADSAVYIDLLCKAKGLPSAENYFDNLVPTAKNTKTIGALLSCFCNEKSLDKAVTLFAKIKNLDLCNVLCYNNMMSLYLNLGEPEKALSLSVEMEDKGLDFDLYTYNLLMNSYASMKKFDLAQQVLERMTTGNTKPDWFTYGNLANIYANAGILNKARRALREMEREKSPKTREAFHTLITLYSRISDLSGVKRSWECLKSKFPSPGNTSHLILLLALSKLGDFDGLDRHFREWESGFSRYDVRVPNVILGSYVERDMVLEAELIRAKIMKNGEPNLRTAELLMKLYVKKGNIGLALKYLEMGVSRVGLERNGWFPSDETVRMFVKYFKEKQGDEVRAEKFCDLMKRVRHFDFTAASRQCLDGV